ncbi:MAG: hypothetical protein MUP70_13540 [Candidatus Aminicenantes bacterium]|nr:hypothetical protein [Candidatus Aminicenantes bacterium]
MDKGPVPSRKEPQRLLKIGQQQILPEQTVMMPVILRGGHGLKRLRLDIAFDKDQLDFSHILKTRQSEDFDELNGEMIADGVLRITGEHSKGIQTIGEGALVRLYFRVRDKLIRPRIIHAGDDLESFRIE